MQRLRSCTRQKNNAPGTCYYCGSYVRSGRQACTPHKISYSTLENILLKDLNAVLHHVNSLEEFIMTKNSENFTIKPERRHDKDKERLLAELNRIQRLKKQLENMKSWESTRKLPDILSIPWIQHILEYREVEHLDREIVTSMLHEIKLLTVIESGSTLTIP